MTLILVTHDLKVARRATRAIHMQDGHVIFDGDSSQLPEFH
jgi:predicted ABC-type transport system involved in lysophospholipase L1 biosynthesis ATPase subunit